MLDIITEGTAELSLDEVTAIKKVLAMPTQDVDAMNKLSQDLIK